MSAGTLALILNFAFVFILLLGFLIGLWRGVKKASLNLGITMVGVVVGFFVSAPITKAVLGMAVVNGQTISQYIVSVITEDPDIKHLYDTTPSFAQTIDKLPAAIINVVMFLFVSIAVMFVAYLIYRIAACFIKRKDKQGNKIPKHRIAGGVVGLVKALVLTLFISMPFVSLIGTTADVMAIATESSEEQQDDGALATVANIVDGLDTSAFGVIGNMFGLDNAMFDYLSAYEVEGQTVYIRQEITNLIDVYDSVTSVSNLVNDGEHEFKDIDFDKLDGKVDKLLNSGFFKTVVSDVAFNLIRDYEDYSFFNEFKDSEYSAILSHLSTAFEKYEGTASEYFSHDIQKLYGAVKQLAKSGALDGSFEDLVTDDEETSLSPLAIVLKDVFDMNLFKDSAPAVFNVVLNQMFGELEEVTFDVESTNWDEVAKGLTNVIKYYADLGDVDFTGLLGEGVEVLRTDNLGGVLDTIGNLVDEFRKIEIFKVDGVSVIDKLLETMNYTYDEFKDDLKYIGQLYDVLNRPAEDNRTYIDLLLDEDDGMEALLKNLSENSDDGGDGEADNITISDILRPLLKAKATSSVRDSLFTTFEDALNALVDDGEVTITINNKMFLESNTDNQIEEVCAVFEKFVALYPSLQNGVELKDINRSMLGELLDTLKVNAYREDLKDKDEEGCFKDAYDSLVEQVKNTITGVRELIGETQNKDINFVELFQKLDELQGSHNV